MASCNGTGLDCDSVEPGSGRSVSASEGHEDQREGSGDAGRASTEALGASADKPACDEGSGTAVDPIESSLRQALELAEHDNALAQLQYLEARNAAETAAKKLARLQAAVSALTGEVPSAPVAQEVERGPSKSEADGSRPSRRSKRKEPSNNPLAHLKCAGCGVAGQMAESYIQAPSGATVRMLICGSCRNQSMLG